MLRDGFCVVARPISGVVLALRNGEFSRPCAFVVIRGRVPSYSNTLPRTRGRPWSESLCEEKWTPILHATICSSANSNYLSDLRVTVNTDIEKKVGLPYGLLKEC